MLSGWTSDCSNTSNIYTLYIQYNSIYAYIVLSDFSTKNIDTSNALQASERRHKI
jgi:hypothetical protein